MEAAHFAQMAKSEGWNIEAALNNDIVGGDRSAQQDTSVVRVFSEGIPTTASEAELRTIRGLGGENDSSSRQLARYIAQVARTYDTGVKPMLVFRSTATCVAEITAPSINRDSRPCVSPNTTRTTTTSTRTCAAKMGWNLAIYPSL